MEPRPDPADHERLLSPTDVAAVLGVPIATLANWRWARTGPAFLRVGRHVRYRRDDLNRWIATQVQVTDTPPR